MSDFLIKNLNDAEIFADKLHSYWNYNSSETFATEIFNYYKIEENYRFIDKETYNYKALALALSDSTSDFINLLLNSHQIINKVYSLKDLGNFFSLGSYPIENVKLVVTAFENKKEIFKDYNKEGKEFFLGGLMNVLLSTTFWESIENEKYFFDLVKRHNIKIYDNEYNIINGLLYYGHTEILDKIINNTENDEDILKVIRKDMSGIEVHNSSIDFLEQKKQQYLYQQFKNLDNELSSNINSNKKNKPKI